MMKKKYPLYWRVFGRFQKLWCMIGLHVPVWAKSDDSAHDEYFCQECAAILSKKYYEKFFGVKP